MDRSEEFQSGQNVLPAQRSQCDSATISKARSFITVALLATAGCGPDAPESQVYDDYGDENPPKENVTIPCKAGDNDYCLQQAYTTAKSAQCVQAKCVPLDFTDAGVCQFDNLSEGTECDDANKCTDIDVCENGVCTGETLQCEWDGDPCHQKSCDVDTGKCNEPLPFGGVCDDKNVCTFEGRCDINGQCQPGEAIIDTAQYCDDNDSCTQDYCEVGEGCKHVDNFNIVCEDDGNPCNGTKVRVCDYFGGSGCETVNKPPDNTSCITNDDKCALESWCQDEECVTKTDLYCNDANPCTTDYCDQFTGSCEYKNKAEGDACGDGDECTKDDKCQKDGNGNMKCVGGYKVC